MKIGISMGDMNGIGLEVVLKSLVNPMILKQITPIIYGSTKVVAYHKNIIPDIDISFQTISEPARAQKGKINVINCWEENVNITLGQATEEGGKYAYIALDRAARDLADGHIDALVTAPINKEAMKMAKFPFPGHTEFLEDMFGGKSVMMMISDSLKVGLVTNHLPLAEVGSAITKELIVKKINIINDTLIRDFDKEKPVIAVLGLNPHAGDNGAIGAEEEKIIRPAILEAKKAGIMVAGPYSADGFFGSSNFNKVDAILAMYHDQGLIPFKSLTFGTGVNYTAGLNYVRTSPDHGTGYNIAGQGIADHGSMVSALFTALEITKNRHQFHNDRKNSIKKREKRNYNESEDEILDDN